MENPCGCDKKYYSSLKGLQVQLNAIQMTGDIDGQMQIIFPNPFLLLGFVQAADLPQTEGSVYPGAQIQLLQATTGDFSDLLQELFIAFMQANQNTDDVLEATRYFDGQFRYYFNKYLNAPNGNAPQNYNTFLMPGSMIMGFWAEQLAHPDFHYYHDVLELTQQLFQVSNKRMWGAPGTYLINAQDGLYQEWDRCFNFAATVDNASLCTENWFNPVPIPLTPLTKAYIAIIPDGDGPEVWGSKTVPYAGAGPHVPNWAAWPNTPDGIAHAIHEWIVAVMTIETGDAPEPFANYPATITTWASEVTDTPVDPFCIPDANSGIQVSMAASQTYAWGTLALAPGAQNVIAIFRDTFEVQPYFRRLTDYVTNNGVLPFILTAELKSVE